VRPVLPIRILLVLTILGIVITSRVSNALPVAAPPPAPAMRAEVRSTTTPGALPVRALRHSRRHASSPMARTRVLRRHSQRRGAPGALLGASGPGNDDRLLKRVHDMDSRRRPALASMPWGARGPPTPERATATRGSAALSAPVPARLTARAPAPGLTLAVPSRESPRFASPDFRNTRRMCGTRTPAIRGRSGVRPITPSSEVSSCPV
jgi:hypothetical protein